MITCAYAVSCAADAACILAPAQHGQDPGIVLLTAPWLNNVLMQ